MVRVRTAVGVIVSPHVGIGVSAIARTHPALVDMEGIDGSHTKVSRIGESHDLGDNQHAKGSLIES
jgi:hypothetical protein